MRTPPGEPGAKIVVSGNHQTDSLSWNVYKLESPDHVPKSHIYLRDETWRARDGLGRAITGIGSLELNGVGVEKSVLRSNLTDLRKTLRDDEVTSDERAGTDELPQKFDEVVEDVNKEYQRSAERIAGQHRGLSGTPGVCDDHRIWLSVEDPWAGWSVTISRIEDFVPRDDAQLEPDIRHAIRDAADSAMNYPSHVETWARHEYQVEYQLDPSLLL